MALFRKYITPFVLVLAIFALNGAEFLHHHDGCETRQQENKCQACIFSSSIQQVIVESLSGFSPVFSCEYTLHKFDTALNDTLKKDNLKNKAPPAA